MKANIQENTDILLTAINDFITFKNELLKSIPEKVEANLSQKHEALLEKFYKYRIYNILSLVFSIAFGTCFTVLFWLAGAGKDFMPFLKQCSTYFSKRRRFFKQRLCNFLRKGIKPSPALDVCCIAALSHRRDRVYPCPISNEQELM